jgi:hypothetical protein
MSADARHFESYPTWSDLVFDLVDVSLTAALWAYRLTRGKARAGSETQSD